MSWIKLRPELYTGEPEVARMAVAVGLQSEFVVGLLGKVWCWADQHMSDMIGGRTGLPAAWFDEYVHYAGFMAAMMACAPHWVRKDGEEVVFCNLQKHNGGGAKRLVMEARRKQAGRNAARRGGRPRAPVVAPVVFPDWLPSDTWVAFLGMCKQRFTLPTKRQQVVLLNTLAGLRAQGHDPQAVLQQSIEQQWRELVPVMPEAQGNGRAATTPRTQRVTKLRVVPGDVGEA